MAENPAHKFGQIIGDLLEEAIEPLLGEFADKHQLYLDKKGGRTARQGRKVAWTDLFGNTHDLDFVIERKGSDQKIGEPVAFIETAWRRYTKHSRNKAQEIQGAIQPLALTHRNAAPFIGVILAGDFTGGALNQLKSLGFNVLYFPYQTVMGAFEKVGIDASFDESTPDTECKKKVQKVLKLPVKKRRLICRDLIQANTEQVDLFLRALEKATTRVITTIRVLPLHGTAVEMPSIEQAISYVQLYRGGGDSSRVARYEIEIKFSNDDRIDGQFADKDRALEFLGGFASAGFHPAAK